MIKLDQLEWCDDPPDPTNNRVERFVDILKQRPGKWAVYPFAVSPNGARAGAARNPKRYVGTEWVVRQGRLYGRWVGDT